MPYRSQTLSIIAARIEKAYPNEAIKLRSMASGIYKEELLDIDIIFKYNTVTKSYDITTNSSIGNMVMNLYKYPTSIPRKNLKSTCASMKQHEIDYLIKK